MANGPNTSSLLAALLLAATLLTGCGGGASGFPPPALPAEDPAQVVWGMEQGGLRYLIETTEDLNMQKGLPLGLTMCVYQLSDYTTFQNIAATAAGIDSLLDCTIDKAGAVSARAYTLQPGQRQDVAVDRQEKARYLAVVAGFTHMKPELCAVVQPFPLHSGKQGILRTQVYSAAPVDATIRLSAESISLTGVERVQ